MSKQEIIHWHAPSYNPDKEGLPLLMKVFSTDAMGFLSGVFKDDSYYASTASIHYPAVEIPKENIIAWCYFPKCEVEH